MIFILYKKGLSIAAAPRIVKYIMTKQITLYTGQITLVDDEDYEYLNQFKWHILAKDYAARSIIGGGQVFMHRELVKTPPGFHTDHKNGNPLDNRKENLRVVTPAQNGANRGISKNNKAYYKGVIKVKNRWRASITVNDEKIHLGYYRNAESASNAYNKIDKILRGEYSHEMYRDKEVIKTPQQAKKIVEKIRKDSPEALGYISKSFSARKKGSKLKYEEDL